MEPDFSLLHSELNLPADCSLEDFKSAYRRRIAELHPDKGGARLDSVAGAATLAALISTYDEVNRFHRRYGRMPGAPSRPNGNDGVRATITMPALPGGFRVAVPTAQPSAEPPARPTWRRLLAFIALIALLATWDWLTLRS